MLPLIAASFVELGSHELGGFPRRPPLPSGVLTGLGRHVQPQRDLIHVDPDAAQLPGDLVQALAFRRAPLRLAEQVRRGQRPQIGGGRHPRFRRHPYQLGADLRPEPHLNLPCRRRPAAGGRRLVAGLCQIARHQLPQPRCDATGAARQGLETGPCVSGDVGGNQHLAGSCWHVSELTATAHILH